MRSFNDYAKGAYVDPPMGIYPWSPAPTALSDKVNTALSNLRFSAESIVDKVRETWDGKYQLAEEFIFEASQGEGVVERSMLRSKYWMWLKTDLM